MASRSSLVAMFVTFTALGLAFAIAVNRIDDMQVQVLLSVLYGVAVLGITRMWRCRV